MRRDPTQWRLEVDQVGPVAVARVANLEHLGENDVQALGEELLRLLNGGRRLILLDLGGVTVVSSSVLGKVLSLYKRAKAEGGRVALCGLSPRLRESLDALQLTRLIPAYEGRQEGVAALTPEA